MSLTYVPQGLAGTLFVPPGPDGLSRPERTLYGILWAQVPIQPELMRAANDGDKPGPAAA